MLRWRTSIRPFAPHYAAKAKADAAAADANAAQKARDALHVQQKAAVASRISGGAPTANAQPAAPKPITPDLAKQYLVKAGGDMGKAKALAAQDGYQ